MYSPVDIQYNPEVFAPKDWIREKWFMFKPFKSGGNFHIIKGYDDS